MEAVVSLLALFALLLQATNPPSSGTGHYFATITIYHHPNRQLQHSALDYSLQSPPTSQLPPSSSSHPPRFPRDGPTLDIPHVDVAHSHARVKMTEQDGPQSPGSTVETSEMDEHTTTRASSPVRPDPRTALQHILRGLAGDTDSQMGTPSAARENELTEDEDARTPAARGTAAPKATASSRKKKATDGGASGAEMARILAGNNVNKIRHLKKDDGEPLWRKDIQYEFLKTIFSNDQAVFTNSYEPPGFPLQTFSQLYIDAMARSSKTSKILRDKLLSEHEPARNMAMVCLLVNLGRMNTTLNCMCLPGETGYQANSTQSFQRCEPNFGHTMQFLLSKPIKTPIPINSYRMPHG